MGLGQLPGRLISGAGDLLGKVATGIVTGGYDAPPENAEYDTIDPRKARWRGFGMDMGAIAGKRQPQNMANRMAMQAEEYNRLGPERLAKRKQAEMEAKIKAQSYRQAQLKEADDRVNRVRDEHYYGEYRKQLAQATPAGQVPLTMDAWKAQQAYKASNAPSKLQVAKAYGDMTPEEQKNFQEANSTGAMGLSNPAYAGILAQLNAQNQYQQTRAGKQAEVDAAFDDYMQTGFLEAQDTATELEGLIADYKSGALDNTTGLVRGRISPLTTREGAKQKYRSILQTLKALQITRLAPVSNEEIALLTKMAEDPARTVEANIGVLEAALNHVQQGVRRAKDREDYFYNEGSLGGYRRTPSTPAPDASTGATQNLNTRARAQTLGIQVP